MSEQKLNPDTDPKKKKPRGLEAPPVNTCILESPVMKSQALVSKTAEAGHGTVK